MGLHRTAVTAAVAVVATAAVVTGGFGSASAAPPSEGCNYVNDPSWDGLFSSTTLAVRGFTAGEVVTVSAELPGPGYGTPGQVTLSKQVYEGVGFIEGPVQVDSAGVPGTLTYTIPADAIYRLSWAVDVGGAQWQVSCEAAPDTPPDDSTPDDSTPDDSTPDDSTPDDSTPDDTSTTSTTAAVDAGQDVTSTTLASGESATTSVAGAQATAMPRFTG